MIYSEQTNKEAYLSLLVKLWPFSNDLLDKLVTLEEQVQVKVILI